MLIAFFVRSGDIISWGELGFVNLTGRGYIWSSTASDNGTVYDPTVNPLTVDVHHAYWGYANISLRCLAIE